MQQYGDVVSQHVESTLLRMNFCRTAALGSRTYRCDDCNYESTVFNSCGDRHCPNCSGAKRRDWMEGSTKLVVDGVTYFQCVFTLPGQLSSLALGNRKLMYDLLFKAAWESLKAKVERELGIQAGCLAVLHTWNQELGHHPHVHLMVPGNGLSLDGQQWIDCRLTQQGKPFLVDNTQLGHDFRDRYLDYLMQAAQAGQLELEDSCYIADLIDDLRLIDWCVFIEGPPKPECPPEQMLKYLTRYMTGGPISDKRLIGEKAGRIWFNIRRRDKQPGQEPFSLPPVEFVRRWTMHILPKEFTKVRNFGCWTYNRRGSYLKACRVVLDLRRDSHQHDSHQVEQQSAQTNVASTIQQSLDAIETGLASLALLDNLCDNTSDKGIETLPSSQSPPERTLEVATGTTSSQDQAPAVTTPSNLTRTKTCRSKLCPHCKQEMKCIEQQARPAWRELFYGPEHPWWFEWTSLGQRPPDLAGSSPPQPEESAEQADELGPDIFQQIIALYQQAQTQ